MKHLHELEENNMKCITVYTNSYQVFIDLYPQLETLKLDEEEERVLDGVTVSESGEVPSYYIERMKQKPNVAVMKAGNHTILQHGDVFEVLFDTAAQLQAPTEVPTSS
jgi:hypothetical protein